MISSRYSTLQTRQQGNRSIQSHSYQATTRGSDINTQVTRGLTSSRSSNETVPTQRKRATPLDGLENQYEPRERDLDYRCRIYAKQPKSSLSRPDETRQEASVKGVKRRALGDIGNITSKSEIVNVNPPESKSSAKMDVQKAINAVKAKAAAAARLKVMNQRKSITNQSKSNLTASVLARIQTKPVAQTTLVKDTSDHDLNTSTTLYDSNMAVDETKQTIKSTSFSSSVSSISSSSTYYSASTSVERSIRHKHARVGDKSTESLVRTRLMVDSVKKVALHTSTRMYKEPSPVKTSIIRSPVRTNIPKITNTARSLSVSVVKKRVVRDTAAMELDGPGSSSRVSTRSLLRQSEDVMICGEYADEIFSYFKECEMKTLPKYNYMEFQPELDWGTRKVLVGWIVEVHAFLKFQPETLFRTVNLIDRFLSEKEVGLQKVQLVGIACLLIAAKYEEVVIPRMKDLLYISSNAFQPNEIVMAEKFVLTKMNYDMSYPGPLNFLKKVTKTLNDDVGTVTLSKYFLEVALMDERFVSAPPSMLASSCVMLSLEVMQKPWMDAQMHASGYATEQLVHVCKMLSTALVEPQVHHATVYQKYASDDYHRASLYVEHLVSAAKQTSN